VGHQAGQLYFNKETLKPSTSGVKSLRGKNQRRQCKISPSQK
jgi:hypothetical protein